MSIVRVLKVPQGGVDDGREVGDDWLLADFGCTHGDDGKEYCVYLTTDRVHGSDPLLDQFEPEKLAKWMADTLNEEWKRQQSGGSNVIRIIDLFLTSCPDCDGGGLLDVQGKGAEHEFIWCEACGWEGKVKELMR